MAQNAEGSTFGRHDYDMSDTSSEERPLTRDEIISTMNSCLSENKYGKLGETIEAMKSESLLIGVIGVSSVGKSSFINNMLGLNDGDEGAAEIGLGDTTLEPKVYCNPQNKQLEFSDLPGFGTPSFEMSDKYLKKIKVEKHDFFLIFYGSTILESDIWIVKKLLALGKKFALVRTRADDLARMKRKSVAECIAEIKTKARANLKKCGIPDEVEVFVISNVHPEIGEYDQLFSYIESNLSELKRMAIVLHVHAKTNKIIEMKEKMLIARAWKAAAFMGATTAIPVPLIDVAINQTALAVELQFYLQTFGLTKDMLRSLPVEKMELLETTFKIHNAGVAQYIIFNLTKVPVLALASLVEEALEILLPVIGSIITGSAAFTIYINFLQSVIKNLAADAKTLRKLYVESLV